MNKSDVGLIGTIATSVFVVMASIMAFAKDWLGKVFTRIKGSFVAVVSSPAVWLAVGLTFVGGFWLGHIKGAVGKRALRSEVATLKGDVQGASAAVAVAQRRAKDAESAASAWKTKAEAAEAEAVRLKSRATAKLVPGAAVSRRPVPSARKTTQAASTAQKTDWVPW
jgi:hypothetical protein